MKVTFFSCSLSSKLQGLQPGFYTKREKLETVHFDKQARKPVTNEPESHTKSGRTRFRAHVVLNCFVR